jgi:LPS-assembly protein
MKLLPLALISLALTTTGSLAQFDVLREKLESLGGLQIDSSRMDILPGGTGISLEGDFRLKSDTMEAYAKKAEFLSETNTLKFTGDVSIYKDGLLYRGERATYNTESGELDATEMRSSSEPLFFNARHLQTESKEVSLIEAEGAVFTTEDAEDPGFRLDSEKVTIYPEERIVFRNVKVYAGDTPVFYLPYLSQPLQEEMGYTFTPGYRSNLGAFLLNQYGSTIGDHSVIKYKLDAYSSRGLGAGFDIESRRAKAAKTPAFGKFKFYWVHDRSPDENNTFTTSDRTGIDSNRYRLSLQHRVYLPGPEESSTYVDLDINKLSDKYFLEDFYPWEFRDDPQPDNLVSLIKHHDRGELSLSARFRANDFYQSDTRSPELALDMVRQPIFDTGIFYASTSSYSRLKEQLGDQDEARLRDSVKKLDETLADPILSAAIDPAESINTLADLRARLVESEFNRFHTYHELLYPKTFGGVISVTPRAGVGYTNYSSISGTAPPENSGRVIASLGLDTSAKFSKVYDDVNMPSLGVDGLRHVVQPYLNYSFVTADNDDKFKGIDRLALSTRPRPLDVNNYTAIDSLRDWNIVRLGVYNRLQTKRDGNTLNWLSTNTYFDTFLDDPEFDRNFSNLYQDIEWNPLPWVRAELGAQLPIFGDNSDFTEVNTRVTFMPVDYLDFTVGHRLLQDHPFFEDSNLLDFRVYARVNENWGFSAYERYELDDSTLETQQYSIHRDLTSWVAAFGATIRDNRGQKDFGLLLSLTLKEFPSVRIPVDFDPNGGSRR